MSKLIVEMEMPTKCAECDIAQKTKTGYRCPIASKMHGFSCVVGRGQYELPHYCPIHGVLSEQHGDLIDRHKTAEELNEMADEVYYDFPLLDRETRIERERGVRMAAQYVENLAGGKIP